MKNRFFIFGILALLFFVPSFSFATNYFRTPSGSNIYSPVSIEVIFGSWSDTGLDGAGFCNGANCNYWGIEIDSNTQVYGSNCFSSSTLSGVVKMPLVVDDYLDVAFMGGVTEDICENIDQFSGPGTYLEGDGSANVIFSVMPQSLFTETCVVLDASGSTACSKPFNSFLVFYLLILTFVAVVYAIMRMFG